jgi:BolA protein
MMTKDRIKSIRDCLSTTFEPTALEIIDESHLHAGHAGARDGRGHFRVRIESAHFHGVATLKRHRMIYDALGSLMQTDIHALSISADTPSD